MKKIFTFIFILSFLYGEPYKPYPIIFIHGYTSNAGTWGADWDKDNRTDTLKGPGKGTYKFFLDKMTPYCIVWDAIDKTYTKPGDTSIAEQPILYPNKSFLEVINFDYPTGSVDVDNGLNFWEIVEPISYLWIITEIINIVRKIPMPYPLQELKGWRYGMRGKDFDECYGGEWYSKDVKVEFIVYLMGVFLSRWGQGREVLKMRNCLFEKGLNFQKNFLKRG